MRASRLGALLVGVLLVVGGLPSCSDDSGPGGVGASSSLEIPASPVPGGTLRLGVERITTMDPAVVSPGSQSQLIAADLLYDGLPQLAASSTPSADFAVWTFVLRSGAVFTNSQPITAADVKYSLERVVRQGVGSLAGSRLEFVKGYGDFLSGSTPELAGVVAVNPQTVEIDLDQPMAELPAVLSAPAFGIMPHDGSAAGSGPFRSTGTEGDVLHLSRVEGAKAYVDGIDLHQYDDLDKATQDVEAGALDWALQPGNRVGQLFYAFNLLDPTFADVRFRQAIVKAIDRSSLVRSVFPDGASVLNGVVPEGVAGHVADPCGAPCAYDPAGARALLAEAFPPGGSPVPTVNLDYFSGTEEAAVAGGIETALTAVGIPVVRRAKTDAEYDQFVTTGQQGLFRFGWIGAYDSPDAYVTALFRSGSRDNVSGFSSADVDGVLASARATADPTARTTLYQQAEAGVMQQVPIVPLAQFETRATVAPRVIDLTIRPDGTFDASAVWLVH